MFAVPLADGSFGLAQAIDHWMQHVIYVALTNVHIGSASDPIPDLPSSNIVSLLAVNDRASISEVGR